MNTNKHERFCGEAALECGGPPKDIRVANLTAFGNQARCSKILAFLGVFGGQI